MDFWPHPRSLSRGEGGKKKKYSQWEGGKNIPKGRDFEIEKSFLIFWRPSCLGVFVAIFVWWDFVRFFLFETTMVGNSPDGSVKPGVAMGTSQVSVGKSASNLWGLRWTRTCSGQQVKCFQNKTNSLLQIIFIIQLFLISNIFPFSLCNFARGKSASSPLLSSSFLQWNWIFGLAISEQRDYDSANSQWEIEYAFAWTHWSGWMWTDGCRCARAKILCTFHEWKRWFGYGWKSSFPFE